MAEKKPTGKDNQTPKKREVTQEQLRTETTPAAILAQKAGLPLTLPNTPTSLALRQAQILQLQRTVGNKVVYRLVDGTGARGITIQEKHWAGPSRANPKSEPQGLIDDPRALTREKVLRPKSEEPIPDDTGSTNRIQLQEAQEVAEVTQEGKSWPGIQGENRERTRERFNYGASLRLFYRSRTFSTNLQIDYEVRADYQNDTLNVSAFPVQGNTHADDERGTTFIAHDAIHYDVERGRRYPRVTFEIRGTITLIGGPIRVYVEPRTEHRKIEVEVSTRPSQRGVFLNANFPLEMNWRQFGQDVPS